MKVTFAFVAAWLLRSCFAFDLADSLEAWAGIDYDPDDDLKWDEMLARVRSEVDQNIEADEAI